MAVLLMSRILSTLIIRAIPVLGMPTLLSTMASITMPTPGVAGDPIEAPTVVIIMSSSEGETQVNVINLSQEYCSRTLVQGSAVHVDSSARGMTNCNIDCLIPSLSSATCIESGITAAELDVENASN